LRYTERERCRVEQQRSSGSMAQRIDPDVQTEAMLVTEIINACDQKRRSTGLAGLTHKERLVALANWATFEIELGGMGAFFHNASGAHAREVVDALIELGAMEEAAAINRGRELLRHSSWRRLATTGHFDRLTDKFLASTPGVFARLATFVELHCAELQSASLTAENY
jgi:hypothetical protein